MDGAGRGNNEAAMDGPVRAANGPGRATDGGYGWLDARGAENVTPARYISARAADNIGVPQAIAWLTDRARRASYILDPVRVRSASPSHPTMPSMRFLAPILAAALAFAHVPAGAQELPPPPSTVPGTVWLVDFVKTREGQLENYLRFNQSFWKPARDEAVRQGAIVSYQMLVLPGNAEWDVILMTEFPDSASYEAREAAFQPILARLRADGPARYQGPGAREMADIRFTRVLRAPPANNAARTERE